jgi:hypothetical protein
MRRIPVVLPSYYVPQSVWWNPCAETVGNLLLDLALCDQSQKCSASISERRECKAPVSEKPRTWYALSLFKLGGSMYNFIDRCFSD